MIPLEWMPPLMFGGLVVFMIIGYPVAFSLAAVGFFFGFLLGIPVAFITHAYPEWWVLPILGVIVGYVTNWVGLWMIFEPVDMQK